MIRLYDFREHSAEHHVHTYMDKIEDDVYVLNVFGTQVV